MAVANFELHLARGDSVCASIRRVTVAERVTATHKPLFASEDVPADPPQRNHRFYYNFTEITITTPPLTRILDRLIGGGINLYSDSV